MRSYLIFFFFIDLLAISCRSNSIIKTSFTCHMPVGITANIIEPYSFTFYKTNYKDAIIYEINYDESFSKNGVLLSFETKYYYFIFNPNDKFGYILYSVNGKFKSKKSVDSVLTSSCMKKLNIDTMYSIVKTSNIETIDKYSFVDKTKVSDVDIDSIYFYYNTKLKNLNYNLSYRQDSIYNSKLFKVEAIIKKFTSGNAAYKNQFRKISYEISKCEIKNIDSLEIVYQRFKKEGK